MPFVKSQQSCQTIGSCESKENQRLIDNKIKNQTEVPVTRTHRQTLVDTRKNDNCRFSFSPLASEHHSGHNKLVNSSSGLSLEDVSDDERTPCITTKSASTVSQAAFVSRKRDIAQLNTSPQAKRMNVRQEKLIIQEADSDDEDVLDYGPEGHLELHEQSTLANRYEILKRLGYGAYGAVYLAKDTDECETVAVKVGCCGEEANMNSSDEIKFSKMVAGSLNCVKLLDSFQESGPHGKHSVLVFEVLGPNLFEVLYRSNQAELTTDRLKKFLRNMLNGLINIHDKKGLIHGDLKPANLMLTIPQSEAGTSSLSLSLCDPCCMTSVKIGDFGISSMKTDTVDWSIQTCAYRAPESFLVSNISTPVDMWSLGCIGYELATREALFPCCHVNDHQETLDHLTKIASELGPIESITFERTETNRQVFDEVFGSEIVFCGRRNMNIKLSVKHLVEKSELSFIEAELFLDFLMMLLKLDPKERMTAQEALNHPFLLS